MRMRVIQAMAGAAQGGAEAFYARLVPALARAGLEQWAVTRPVPERLEALAREDVPVLELGFGNPYLDLLSRWKFRGAIKEFRPDIVVTWANRATAVCPSSPVAGHRFLKVGRPSPTGRSGMASRFSSNRRSWPSYSPMESGLALTPALSTKSCPASMATGRRNTGSRPAARGQ